MLVVLEELYKTFRAVVKLLTLFVPVRVVSTVTLRTVSLRRGSIVAKAETVYLPVRTKCVTFVTTPLGVVVVVCVIKTTWPLVVFDQYVRN